MLDLIKNIIDLGDDVCETLEEFGVDTGEVGDLLDAAAYEKRVNADAELYSKQKEAEGNIALAKSVTSDLLALRDKEVQLKTAENWKGGCTQDCTVFGEESSAPAPLYHMNRK